MTRLIRFLVAAGATRKSAPSLMPAIGGVPWSAAGFLMEMLKQRKKFLPIARLHWPGLAGCQQPCCPDLLSFACASASRASRSRPFVGACTHRKQNSCARSWRSTRLADPQPWPPPAQNCQEELKIATFEAAAPKRQAIGKATERIRDQIEESLYRRQTAQGLRARRLHRYVGTISSGRIEGKQRSCRYLRYSATEMSLTLRTS